MLAGAAALLLSSDGSAQTTNRDDAPVGDSPWRRHGFYIGYGAGSTTIRLADNARSEEGIDFTFDAEVNDVATALSAGYWINDNVGIELATRDYGAVNVAFEFADPHDNTAGTGEADASFWAGGASLLLGYDVLDNVQVYGRAGAMAWTRDMETRFDIPGEPAMYRETEDSGTGLHYGAGIDWRFDKSKGWHLRLQVERTTFDDDEIDMVGVSLLYDFTGARRPRPDR
jgi:opacity protein-like surface antigen